MTYTAYLDLNRLLAAQHPHSDHSDELLFIVQHQVTELWLKLALHELRRARTHLCEDDLQHALKDLARIKHLQRSLIEQWSVLTTLTPSEFAGFRPVLGQSSGIQSYQYRAVEFVLGNKDKSMLAQFDDEPAGRDLLVTMYEQPTIYDAFLAYLARHDHGVPADILARDVREPWVYQAGLVPVFRRIYESVDDEWRTYEACEALIDVEHNFQVWRFRHLQVVARTIGARTGTGGSSGTAFLRRALDLTFFPELFAVRSEVVAG
ncbi:MAG: tryptophan 2,3-dioxygenase family protein [Pseudonocardia sp.]|nr:tryptophan 2,3-dioxygenase family protein [Pseudonocardia sp.]